MYIHNSELKYINVLLISRAVNDFCTSHLIDFTQI